MANNPLIKENKHGYGYGYGYGYGEDVPLLPQGKRNLTIALIIIALGLTWLGYRFLIWHELRQLNAASVSWSSGDPDAAWKHLRSVGQWAVDKEHYQKTTLTLLLERDPATALTYAQGMIAESDFAEYKDPNFPQRAQLWAAIRSQNWETLSHTLSELEQRGALSEDSPQRLTAEAWLLLSQGESKAAWESLQQALKRNPYDTEARLLRSELQARSNNRADRNQALVSLREVVAKGDSDSVRASLLLLTSGLLELEADWQSEIARLAENPYLETHYLFARDTALRATLAAIRGRDAELCYRFTRQLAAFSSIQSQELAEWCFYAQEVGELEEATQALQRYIESNDSHPLEGWLQARQAWYQRDLDTALELSGKGLETAQSARFLPLLAAFAQEQDYDIAPTQQKAALTLLVDFPGLNELQWDFAARQLWALDPSQHDKLVEQALNWSQRKPILASRFLLDQEQAKEALQALEPIGSPLPNAAIELKFRALVELRKLEDARKLLDETPAITPFTQLSGKLMLALLSGESSKIETNWQIAWEFAQAQKNPAALAALGDLCFEYKAYSKAQQAYRLSQDIDPSLPISADSLRRIATLELDAKQTRTALDLIELALSRDPKSVELQRQWSYYSILLNTKVLEAKDILRALYERRKEDQAIATAMAFSYLRTGQKGRALALLELKATDETESESHKAIRYAALIANGRKEEAAQLREQINESKLLPEELALIDEFEPVVIEKITLPEIQDDARLIDLQKDREEER